jgi:hypothetical protein
MSLYLHALNLATHNGWLLIYVTQQHASIGTNNARYIPMHMDRSAGCITQNGSDTAIGVNVTTQVYNKLQTYSRARYKAFIMSRTMFFEQFINTIVFILCNYFLVLECSQSCTYFAVKG